MLSLTIGFLTVVLVLDAAFLILLVLIQLPKKEAGLGTAFGGGMTDALFGAGTGNVLTKATRWSATIFLLLSLTLSILNSYQFSQGKKLREEQLLSRGTPAQVALPAAMSNAAPAAGLPLQSVPPAPAATAPAAPAPTATTTPATKAPAPSAPATTPPAPKK